MINKVAIFGGGTIGRQIARICAAAEKIVYIKEVGFKRKKESKFLLEKELTEEIDKWLITESERKVILSRIKYIEDDEEIEDVDLVIESIPEDLQLKRKLFETLERSLGNNVIFVTNTATLSVTEIARNLMHKERLIGMHFMTPVSRTKIVELVKGEHTSDETLKEIKQFAYDIQKTPIEVFEFPGFVVTRLIVPMINEAINVLMEGVSDAEQIDKAIKFGFNMPYGPLELADNIGLDVVYSWMENLFREYGELKYRPCPLLRKMVRSGKLGIKSSQGFYRYDEKGKKIKKEAK